MKKIVSIINLKGGVAKTTTAVNFAYELAVRGDRVLVVDNDKQGNLSKAFRCYDPSEQYTVAYLMTEKDADVSKAVAKTEYENIDIIPANMNLANANMSVMMDMSRQQQTRLHKAFVDGGIYDIYDYMVIDNAPDINISIINALTISTDVIVPLIIDQYSMDGLDILTEQLQPLKKILISLIFNFSRKYMGRIVKILRSLKSQVKTYMSYCIRYMTVLKI